MPGDKALILISILSLGRPDHVLSQLADLPAWLDELAQDTGTLSHIIVRNNDPLVDFGDVAARMVDIRAGYPHLACTLITDVANNGFGLGHNGNVALAASDYVLILNDDIGFPHIAWLADAVRLLHGDARTACVGADENPKHINPLFANGLLPGAFHLHTINYAEASILLFKRAVFDSLGGFCADFAWAMCEDSDLSLRVQQHGMRIAYLSMPHQHWRSTSFNALPGSVKSSILEHNRAAFFANWRDSLTAGRVGRFEVFDVWSDGLGDVFCALPHVLARIAPLGAARRANIIINTSHPALFEGLGVDGVRILSVRDLDQLRADLAADGITSIRSMRDSNFSLPFNIQTLLAGTLGLEPAGPGVLAGLAASLRRRRLPPGLSLDTVKTACVLHLEFDRNHEGRALSTSATLDLLTICGEQFQTIILVGRERRLSAALFGATSANIIDLQGTLSLGQLTAVIAGAQYFVGIDSFPGHVAQSCQVPAAIIFGAVHPQSRLWQEDTLWPITADLACIGCYHTHLEPSVPFCMRRDQACVTIISPDIMRGQISAMIAGRPHNWADLRRTWQGLQAKLIKLTCHHPAPPERVFRRQAASNERMANFIYRITEQMGDLLHGHYNTSTVNTLAARTHDLQAELYAAQTALDAATRRVPSSADATNFVAAPPAPATRIMQLQALPMETVRCQTTTIDQWIEVNSADDDPQILLPPLVGYGAKLQLRISFIAEPNDALQIYWATGDALFSAEQMHTVLSSGAVETANLMFDPQPGSVLRIRIDPITGIGTCRLRGSLGGMFVLADPTAAPPAPAVESATPAAVITAKPGRRHREAIA